MDHLIQNILYPYQNGIKYNRSFTYWHKANGMVISGIVRKPDFEGSFLFESIIFNKANIALSKQGKDSD